jgi:hypothetical protein
LNSAEWATTGGKLCRKENEMIDIEEIRKIDQFEDFEGKVLQAALYYISQGLYVLPLPKGGKSLPPSKTGINYTSASKKPETIIRWFGSTGKFRGHNIGIACGREDGVVAIDLDVKYKDEKIDAEERFQALVEIHGQPVIGPVQRTPSGGKHILMQWAPNLTSSTSKLDKGIDTRGGSAATFGGHIVAWPSKTSDGVYTWEEGGEINPAPIWIIEAMGESWRDKEKNEGGRGNEEVVEEDLETKYTTTQLKRMMGHINIEELSYDEWLYVGQALHTQHPNDKGLELWDQWSQQGSRYQPNECHLRWHKFAENGPIRIGTLVAIAKKFGYDPRTQGNEHMDADEGPQDLIDEMNKKYAVAVIGGSVRIIMEKESTRMDPLADRFVLLDKTGFNTLMANENIVVRGQKGKATLMNKGDIWLADENRRTYPNGIVFSPGNPKEMDGCYNTWEPWKYQPYENGSWEKLQDHIKFILCKGDQRVYDWIIDWMADILQDPRNPKGSAIVMSGAEGTGKGTLAHAFGALFGGHYKHVTQEEHLTGRFNGHLQDAILVFADEVTYGGSKKTAGQLKAMVTEPSLMTERKGVDAHRSANYIRLMVASNESWFIPAGPQSRRWLVINADSSKANNESYFKGIRNQLKDGGYERMMHDLLNRKIKSNLRFAPETKALNEQRMILSVQDSVIEWWTGCLSNGYIDNLPSNQEWTPGQEDENSWKVGTYPTQQFYGLYETWAMSRKAKREPISIFSMTMRKLGIESRRTRIGDQRLMAVSIPSLETCIKELRLGAGIDIGDEE